MTKRSAFTAAIGLTVFIMMLAAGVLYQLSVSDTTVASAQTPAQTSGDAAGQAARTVEIAAPTVKVTADQAAAIAIKSAPNSRLLRAPELVNFQGAVAYEVTLAGGTIYIDAASAQVIYNGTSVVQGAAQRHGEHEHGAEHGTFFGLNWEHDDD